MYAASLGEEEIVRLLLAAGADPAYKDRDGDTPRSIAIAKGHQHIADVLDEATGARSRSK